MCNEKNIRTMSYSEPDVLFTIVYFRFISCLKRYKYKNFTNDSSLFIRYPIYQIPFTRNAKDLSACFITYNTLSSFQGKNVFLSLSIVGWEFNLCCLFPCIFLFSFLSITTFILYLLLFYTFNWSGSLSHNLQNLLCLIPVSYMRQNGFPMILINYE